MVASKKEGGEWGATELPHAFHDLVTQCLNEYSGASQKIEYNNQILVDFATYMLEEITDRVRY
jgi:hypothetical protein